MENLLTEIAQCYCEDIEIDYFTPMGHSVGNQFASKILSKILEVVEGAGLTDEEVMEAFDGDFGEVFFDHEPTADEIFLIKLKLVTKAQLNNVKKAIKE